MSVVSNNVLGVAGDEKSMMLGFRHSEVYHLISKQKLTNKNNEQTIQ